MRKNEELDIIVDPDDKTIDEDLEKADIITRIHGCKNEQDIKDMLKSFSMQDEMDIVYVHYYTKDKNYMMGVKIN